MREQGVATSSLYFYLFGVASTALLLGLAAPDLLLSALPRLYDAAFGHPCLFLAVIFIVLVILNLTSNSYDDDDGGGDSPESGPGDVPLRHPEEEEEGEGLLQYLSPSTWEVSPAVWYDAPGSPPSLLHRDEDSREDKNDKDQSPGSGGAAGIPREQKRAPLRRSSLLKVSLLPHDVSYDGARPSPPFVHVSIDESNSSSGASTRNTTGSSPGGQSDVSCQTTDLDDEAPPSSPAPAVPAKSRTEPSEAKAPPAASVDEEDDSMDATWAEITGSATGERRLKKNRTWDSSTRVQLEQSREAAGRRELRKSQTFQEESAEAVAARRAVLERRMKGKEVEVAADHNVMDRQFDDFIEKVYGQLRLQRQESLRRRYLEITP